jgi:hypothetical protein
MRLLLEAGQLDDAQRVVARLAAVEVFPMARAPSRATATVTSGAGAK